MINISLFKILGIFSTVVILGIFLSGTIIGVIHSVKEGDWKAGLAATGGRIFALDYALKEETDLLLNRTAELQAQEGPPAFYEHSQITFHIVYSFIILFMLFFLMVIFFKIGNWMMGIRQFSWTTDVFIVIMLAALFFILEFFYVYFLLDETMIPIKDGIWYFVKNLPGILKNAYL